MPSKPQHTVSAQKIFSSSQLPAQPTHLCLLAEGGAATVLPDGPGYEEVARRMPSSSLGQGWGSRGAQGKCALHHHHVPLRA